MPRLVGKKANPSLWLVPLIAIAAIGVVAQMEYSGTLNLMPKIGRHR
ncbi:MAG: hypothetical protein NT070_15520 [Cyanobacteria bacterium]|nr:hypothetical protein [Cyanobacteriota bacterium]